MTTIPVPFDTLKMVDSLVAAGVPDAQARIQTQLLADVISAEDASIVERFSNKHDVTQELTSIHSTIDRLDSKNQIALEKIDTKITALDFKIDSKILELESKFSRLGSKIDKTAAEVKSELIRWMVSVGGLQIAIIAGLMLKLAH